MIKKKTLQTLHYRIVNYYVCVLFGGVGGDCGGIREAQRYRFIPSPGRYS
ncbi:hypothetical protein ES705_20530 [subsurface metagenome]